MKKIKNSICDRCSQRKTLYEVSNYELCWPCVNAAVDGH